jgi:hypothetical protein
LGKRRQGRCRNLNFHISSIIEIIETSRREMSVAIRYFASKLRLLSPTRGYSTSTVVHYWRNFVNNS